MNQPTFFQSVERGFAQGVGTLVAYGVALLALTYLVKAPQPAASSGQTGSPQPISTSCSSAYA